MVKGYVERNIKAVNPKIPFKAVHASIGKAIQNL